MRKRIQCKHLLQFGKEKNPCHKILCEIEAKDIIENENETVVIGLTKLRLKCRCGGITEIINQEEEIK